jgi:hypothetical protein
MQKQVKTFSASLDVSKGERAVVAKISVEVCDRQGEVVRVDGINSKDYEANPLLCWQHDYTLPPIGKCESLKRVGDALVAKFIFAERPDNHPTDCEWLPDVAFDLYQQGAMNGFSIGFVPVEIRHATNADRERWGDETQRIIGKCNLLEVSAVTLPANPEAVSVLVSKGMLQRVRARELFNIDLPDEPREPVGAVVNRVIEPEQPEVRRVHHLLGRREPDRKTIERLVRKSIRKMQGFIYED